MDSKNLMKIVAYHGTTRAAAVSILRNSFKINRDDEDWLGSGVYFFIHGISDPIDNAFEWAKNHHNHPPAIIQIEAIIGEDDILNLTTSTGLSIYNQHRELIIKSNINSLQKRRDLSIKKRRDIRLDDCIITNLMQEQLRYKALIHNVYIKKSYQRELILESSYPNSTVLCINDLSTITNIKIHQHHNKKTVVE
jgi:hypothetical protein